MALIAKWCGDQYSVFGEAVNVRPTGVVHRMTAETERAFKYAIA